MAIQIHYYHDYKYLPFQDGTTSPKVDTAVCSKNAQFVENFYYHLVHEMNLVDPKSSSDMPAPLSSVTHGQPFTKECLDEKSFGINDFLTRYEAEEVEWFLNKPIDKNKGNTLLHEAVFSRSTKQMEIILKHGGNYIL